MTLMTKLIAAIIFFLLFVFVILYDDKKRRKIKEEVEFWSKPLQNFPFKYMGRTLWYSRSVATTLFAFSKNEFGEMCVLANKRGKGCPDFQGYWNVVCGYLDFNENSIQCAIRECLEETGLKIPYDRVEVVGVNSEPSSNKQNVSIRHKVILDGTINEWSNFNTDNMEKDEVEEIRWIPLSEVKNYKWAFGHEKLITEIVHM